MAKLCKICHKCIFYGIRKDGPSRRRGSLRLCSEQSETKDRIPLSPPVIPIRTFVFIIKQGKSLYLCMCYIIWLKFDIPITYNVVKV